MTRVLIIGANGAVSKATINAFLENTSYTLRLFLRDANRLPDYASDRIRVREGDATNYEDMDRAMEGVDIVFAALSGDLAEAARTIVDTMLKNNIQRLIFVTSLGIYNEVPGDFGAWVQAHTKDYLSTYKRVADIIENSTLDYTIFRPAWLTNTNEIDYEITKKDEAFKGTEVSRKSVAVLAVQIAKQPTMLLKDNIGIHKPNTDFDKPSWY
ncbi:NAD(P)H-binding protein [Staphylococcus caeli]|uniref:NAD(P)H-binding protein n=1 Tax=Staphylococcus caeli TaxID=2201815 RepID=UPI003F55FC64